MSSHKPVFHSKKVDPAGLEAAEVAWVEAGPSDAPNFILLHGFPSSSTQFRDLIPLLSDSYHVYAPDLPGFGLTKVSDKFEFTFDNLAKVIDAWIQSLGLTSYAFYVFDYGAPTGFRIALDHPEQVKAFVSQNGNAYEEGFGQEFWSGIFKLWETNNSEEARNFLRDNVLTIPTTKFQYTEGVPESDIKYLNPTQWHTDYLQNLAGPQNQKNQLDLFYDYRTNPPLYPKFQEYFEKSKVPVLAVWGKGDPAFIPPGAEGYKKHCHNPVIEFVESGHFALENKRWEIAASIKKFLSGVKF